jgi:hypothetical protein
MADDFTPAPDSASAAPAEPASSSSTPDSSGATDTRAIAASVFGDAPGETETAPPVVDPSTPPPPPVAARSDDEDDAEYQKLLASGSMPVHRHQAVLTNARKKTRAEVEQEFRARYGWVDERKLDRAQTDQALGLMDALNKNPEQTLRTIAQALGVSLAPPTAPAEPEGPPPPDVRLEDGSEFYSAAQLSKLRAWQDAQYDKKLAALEERWKPIEAERHLVKLEKESKNYAGSILNHYRTTRKHFSALESDIKALMIADPTLELPDAYSLALETKLIPQQQAQAATDRASQLTRKAAASSAPPGAARPVTPLKSHERSTRDLAAMVFAQG